MPIDLQSGGSSLLRVSLYYNDCLAFAEAFLHRTNLGKKVGPKSIPTALAMAEEADAWRSVEERRGQFIRG